MSKHLTLFLWQATPEQY